MAALSPSIASHDRKGLKAADGKNPNKRPIGTRGAPKRTVRYRPHRTIQAKLLAIDSNGWMAAVRDVAVAERN